MMRLIGGVVAGVIVWGAVVTLLNLGLRHGWADYAAVEKAMAFTVPMMAARLSMSGVSSLAGGYAAARIGNSGRTALVSGIVLLLPFIYVHYTLWNKFPIWYHLTFLTSLVVLSIVGAMFARTRSLA